MSKPKPETLNPKPQTPKTPQNPKPQTPKTPQNPKPQTPDPEPPKQPQTRERQGYFPSGFMPDGTRLDFVPGRVAVSGIGSVFGVVVCRVQGLEFRVQVESGFKKGFIFQGVPCKEGGG